MDPQVRAKREAIVRAHMESENVHDFDATIGTFSHPRYELIPSGQVHDGEAAVRAYFTCTDFTASSIDPTASGSGVPSSAREITSRSRSSLRESSRTSVSSTQRSSSVRSCFWILMSFLRRRMSFTAT